MATHKEYLERYGYLILPGEHTKSDMMELRELVDEECDGEEWGDGTEFEAFALNGTLSKIFEKIWPEGYHLTTWCIRIAQPGCRAGDWHVDYPTHDLEEPYPDIIHGIQIVIAIDDFTLENGATEVIPGSQTSGIYPREKMVNTMEKERVTMKAGSIGVWDSRLWHHSMPNTTGKPRRSFVGAYASKDIPVKE